MSKSTTLPNFDILCDSLLSLGAINSPSELHGLVSGKLSGGAKLDQAEWHKEAAEFLDLTSTPDERADELISAVLSVTQKQFEGAEFGVQLLLPSDESDLATRADCLGQWCHGFLTGFGSAGISGDRPMSADVSDAVRDLAAIVQIGGDEESEAGEAGEANFMEIVEYVRVAAMTVHAECAQLAAPSADKSSNLH